MDNKYYAINCPARMGDARFLTNYERSRRIDQEVRKNNNINNVNDFTLFLQTNGESFIRNESEKVSLNNCRFR